MDPGGAGPYGEGRRAELLAVAAGLISRSGYSGTSLREVGEAAGIQAGSIYHHFASKEMLAVELVGAFHRALEAAAAEPTPPDADPVTAIRDFARRAGEVAEQHRAAVVLGMYDPPRAAGETLRELVRRTPPGYAARWRELIAAATGAGRIAPEVDPELLRFVLQDPVLELSHLPGVGSAPAVVDALLEVVLDGVAVDPPPPAELDRSAAAETARKVVRGWHTDEPPRDRKAVILAAARLELARRGYDATTMRDIAKAAGMGPSSIYRHFDSKESILAAVVEAYSHTLLAAFEEIVAASGTAVEALDGLMLLMSSASDHFRHEFAIMRAWWSMLDLDGPDPSLVENNARLRLLTTVLDQGAEAGELRAPRHPVELPLALRDVLWTAPDPDHEPARRLVFLRRVILRGAAVPATPRP